MTRRISDNNFWNCRLGQISHFILSHYILGGSGIRGGGGCVKIMLIVSCSEWVTCLFLFIMVEFEKLLYRSNLKMVHIFLVTKVFQKDTMFKNEPLPSLAPIPVWRTYSRLFLEEVPNRLDHSGGACGCVWVLLINCSYRSHCPI